MKNKLAIIIPYYKITFFEETLKSVASQTNKNFSLYIGNDNSPDDPLSLIQKYFNLEECHYFNYQENFGGKNLVSQWNRILENASEEWFQILGDDDMIAENFVEEFYTNLPQINAENINVIKCSQFWIDEKNYRITEKTQSEKIIKASSQFLLEYNYKYRSSLSEHIFNRKSFESFGFKEFPLAWHSDNLAVYEVSCFNKIYFLDKTTVMIRMSDVNISSKNDNYEEKDLAKHLYREYLFKNYFSILPKPFLIKELDGYREYLWRKEIKSKLPLFKLYLKLGNPRKAIGSIIHKK